MLSVKLSKKTRYSCEFELKNANITTNLKIANILRRAFEDNIEYYAFDKITIDKNTSIYNNSELILYIQNIPVLIENYDKDKKYSIRLNLNMKNEKNKAVNVMTKHCTYILDDVETKYPSTPSKILFLKPGEEITINAIATKNRLKTSAIYSPIYENYYTYDDPSLITYRLSTNTTTIPILELTKEIYEKIATDVSKFLSDLKSNDDIKKQYCRILINDIDFALINYISMLLLEHADILYCGTCIIHPINNNIILEILSESSNTYDLLSKCCTSMMKTIKEYVDKISKIVSD